MLFKRYSNPLVVLRRYNLQEMLEFFVCLFNEIKEEKLWEEWINGERQQSFDEFKNSRFKKKQDKKMTESESEKAIDKAERILGRR